MRKYLLPTLAALSVFSLTFSGLFYLWSVSFRQIPWKELSEDSILLKEGVPGKAPVGAELLGLPRSVRRAILKDRYGIVHSDTTYVLNDWALRDDTNEGPPKKHHLLVSGCSYAFGHHLPFEDVVTTILRKNLPDTNVRNLSWPGGSPHTSIRYLEKTELTPLVPEEEGVFVYLYISDHINRWVLARDYLRWAPGFFPYYEQSSSDIRYKGKLSDYPEWKAMFRRRDFDYYRVGPEDIRNFVASVAHMKDHYLRQFPRGKFIWMIHPLSVPINSELHHFLLTQAKEKGLELVESEWPIPPAGKRSRDFETADRHPGKKTNVLLAEFIRSRITSSSEGTVKR